MNIYMLLWHEGDKDFIATCKGESESSMEAQLKQLRPAAEGIIIMPLLNPDVTEDRY